MCFILCWRRSKQRPDLPYEPRQRQHFTWATGSFDTVSSGILWNEFAVVVPRSDRGHEAMNPPTRFQGEVARAQELSTAAARAENDELQSAIGSTGVALETLQYLDSEDRRREEISSGRGMARVPLVITTTDDPVDPVGESEIPEPSEVANQAGKKDRSAPGASNIERLEIPDVGGSGFQSLAQLEESFQPKKSPQLSALPTPTPAAPLGGRTERLRSSTKWLTTQEEPQRQEGKKSRWRGLKWAKNLF